MKKPPEWATMLMEQVLKDEGLKIKPVLNWRDSKRSVWSSGQAWHPSKKAYYRYKDNRTTNGWDYKRVKYTARYKITITAGSQSQDQRLVLLHELAHVICPKNVNHGAVFWRKAWELYKRYGVDLEYALNREKGYRKESEIQYRKMFS